jgi:hypothetical protein
MRWRHAPSLDGQADDRVASDRSWQALTIIQLFNERRCLTPAFSGAANGKEGIMRNLRRGLRCNGLLDPP